MKTILSLALPLVAFLGTPTLSQEFPARSVALVSPNNPGGANDTVARIFANYMSRDLGQRVIVENIGGAGGIIGGQTVAEADPDGYTLLVGSVSTHSFAPVMQADLAYDPVADFAPVSLFATVPNLLVANADLGVSTVEELVALAKERSGELNYASGGIGSTRRQRLHSDLKERISDGFRKGWCVNKPAQNWNR